MGIDRFLRNELHHQAVEDSVVESDRRLSRWVREYYRALRGVAAGENVNLEKVLTMIETELHAAAPLLDPWVHGLETDLAQARNEIEKQSAETQRLSAETATAQDALAKKQGEIAALSEELAGARATVIERDRDVDRLGTDLTTPHAALSERDREIQEIRKSTSWRVTAPLRATKYTILGLRGLPIRSRRTMIRVARAVYHRLPVSYANKRRLLHFVFASFGALFQDLEIYQVWRANHVTGSGKTVILPRLLVKSPSRNSIGPRAHLTPSNANLGVQWDVIEIDVSIVTHDSANWLDNFFESLLSQNFPPDRLSLLITDNRSSDDTWHRLTELKGEIGHKFRRFELTQSNNNGFGAGHNCNFEKGKADFFLVTNVNLTFEPNTLLEVTKTAGVDAPDVAVWELRQKPYEHPKFYDPVTLETAWCSAACALYRRSAFKDVGGFDEAIFMYVEDVEISYRLRDRGYRLRYCPKATVYHFRYEYAGQVKPLQFSESIIGNAYIRLRYGTLREILIIPGMFAALALKGNSHQRSVAVRQFAKLLLKGWHFLLRRKRSRKRFGIIGWDYEMRREGAFYRLGESAALPKVSVIIRTYPGRLSFLREAVSTVLNQTYPNVEILVVEDGGDSAKTFLSDLARKGVNVTYLEEPKLGRCHTGNVGLAVASGEFLMFLDDDDGLFADHVEVLAHRLVSEPNLPAAYALCYEVPTKIISQDPLQYEEEAYLLPLHHRQKFSRGALEKSNLMPIQAVLFRRRTYERHGGFFTELDVLEDWNLWLRYSKDGDFFQVEKTTSYYRVPADPSEQARRLEYMQNFYDKARMEALAESLPIDDPERLSKGLRTSSR